MDMKCLYLISLYNPPTMWSYTQKRWVRRLGSAMYFPFWRGFDGAGMKFVKGSPAEVVFQAGKKYRELGGKDYSIK